jgi:hypothetical protein
MPIFIVLSLIILMLQSCDFRKTPELLINQTPNDIIRFDTIQCVDNALASKPFVEEIKPSAFDRIPGFSKKIKKIANKHDPATTDEIIGYRKDGDYVIFHVSNYGTDIESLSFSQNYVNLNRLLLIGGSAKSLLQHVNAKSDKINLVLIINDEEGYSELVINIENNKIKKIRINNNID